MQWITDSEKNAAGLDQFNDGQMIWYPPIKQDVLIPDKPAHKPQKSNSCTLMPAHGYYIIGKCLTCDFYSIEISNHDGKVFL